MGTPAVKNSNIAPYMVTPSATMTQQLIEQYLDTLEQQGRQQQTIRTYRRGLAALYDFLPAAKEITQTVLENWREDLKAHGYSDNTVNSRLAAANGFLRYCGAEGLTAHYEKYQPATDAPLMTRSEYLRFLSAVCRLGNHQEYLLIKVFGSMDIAMYELPLLTVEACRAGEIRAGEERTIHIPPCLRDELIEYVVSCGRTAGAVFTTRSGKSLDRSNIARSIRNLALEVGMDPEKVSPGALHRMYEATQEEIEAEIRPFYIQTYDNLLAAEQAVVAWG